MDKEFDAGRGVKEHFMRRKELEITGNEGIGKILELCRTCRVAMVDGDMPYVVPLSFGYKFTGESALELYFHSAREGRKLDILRKNNKVCFDISTEGDFKDADSSCNSGFSFSSVIGNGEAVFVGDAEEKTEALKALCLHQTKRKPAFDQSNVDSVCVFKIVSTDYTGKQNK
jgi:nitroimidazol reductase NimA-like FMN-containing flavoprotein (pyridoxamine 5'-phosphate oxidase superfamily)